MILLSVICGVTLPVIIGCGTFIWAQKIKNPSKRMTLSQATKIEEEVKELKGKLNAISISRGLKRNG